MQTKSAFEVIKPFKEQHPDMKFAVTDNLLGTWGEESQRFIPFASLTITGQWVFMPYEIMVDGKHLERKWIPV